MFHVILLFMNRQMKADSAIFVYLIFYCPAIRGMLERAYSVTPVRPSPSASDVSNLRLSFSGGATMSFGHSFSSFKKSLFQNVSKAVEF